MESGRACAVRRRGNAQSGSKWDKDYDKDACKILIVQGGSRRPTKRASHTQGADGDSDRGALAWVHDVDPPRQDHDVILCTVRRHILLRSEATKANGIHILS